MPYQTCILVWSNAGALELETDTIIVQMYRAIFKSSQAAIHRCISQLGKHVSFSWGMLPFAKYWKGGQRTLLKRSYKCFGLLQVDNTTAWKRLILTLRCSGNLMEHHTCMMPCLSLSASGKTLMWMSYSDAQIWFDLHSETKSHWDLFLFAIWRIGDHDSD